MSRKTMPAGRKSSATTGQIKKSKPKDRISVPTTKASRQDGSMPQKALTGPQKTVTQPQKTVTQSQKVSTKPQGAAVASVTKERSGRTAEASRPQVIPADTLAKVEANIAAAVESLNNQMNAAMGAMTELAAAQRGRGEDYLRTAPLDRATATFQRLVGEVLDDHLVEMLPILIALRCEMAEKAGHSAQKPDDDFFRRGTEMLDQVLSTARVSRYDARVGETFDPLIHVAVGEVRREDLADGAVAEFLQPGFRTARGKIVMPAKVKVNRR